MMMIDWASERIDKEVIGQMILDNYESMKEPAGGGSELLGVDLDLAVNG